MKPTLADRAKGLIIRWIAPTIENFSTRYTFDSKGISPGKEIGGGQNMVIWKPGGGQAVNDAAAMQRNTGWAYAAVSAIADEIAGIEWEVYKIQPDGDHELVMESEMLDLLNGVNERQTGVEFKHIMASHLELTGSAYILLLKEDGTPVASDMEKPAAMHLMNPGKVTVMVNRTTFPYTVEGYKLNMDGKSWSFQAYQVLHIKYPDPNSETGGMGTIAGIVQWLDSDNAVTAWNNQFFSKGAKPSGTLTHPYKTEAQTTRLTTSFEENYSGMANAQKVVALPDGVKFVADPTPKDMDFGSLLDRMEDRILSGFRVSRTILGTSESDTTRSTAETADYIFAKRTIRPKMRIITSYLNEFLVPRFGEDIYLSFEDPVPEDRAARSVQMQAAVGNAPVISVNEARDEYLGLGPISGGDELLVPNTMVPADSAGDEPTEPPAPSTEPQKEVKKVMQPRNRVKFTVSATKKVTTRFAKNAKIRSDLGDMVAGRIAKELAAIRSKDLWDMTHEEYFNVWKDFVSRVEKYEHQLAEEVRKLNNTQMEVVLAHLSDATGVEKAIDEKDLFDVAKWVGAMIDVSKPILEKLGRGEAKYAANAINMPEAADVFETPEHQAALDKSIELMSQSYQDTTMQMLKSKLDEGISAGYSLDQLSASVRDIYEFSDERRASLVAKTESFRIANDTTKATWKASGVVSTIKWYTAEDSHVCDFCAEQDGKVVSVDDDFYSKGDTITAASGATMDLDYSDVGAPPLHPDCRCYVRPEDVDI